MARDATNPNESIVRDKENIVQDVPVICESIVSNSEGHETAVKPLEIVEVKYGKKWWVCEITSRKRGGACWVRFQVDGCTLRIPPSNIDSQMRPLSIPGSAPSDPGFFTSARNSVPCSLFYVPLIPHLVLSKTKTSLSATKKPRNGSSTSQKRPKVYRKKIKIDEDLPCQVS